MTLRLREVSVPGAARPRLVQVCATLRAGEPTLVLGPNGAGKSTLLRAILGLDPCSGTVSLDDAPLSAMHRLERAAAVAWLPQHPRLEEGMTALDVVASARFRFREPWPASCAAAQRALERLEVGGLAQRRMDTLSGGEAQRVRLASLAAQEARWWLLDEPANHLDPGVRLDLLDVVRAEAARGTGVLLVTHDLTLLDHLPDAAVLALEQGRVVFTGPAADPTLPDVLGALMGLDLARVPVSGGSRLVVLGRRGASA